MVTFCSEITETENKIPDITGLVTETDFSTNISEFENKIPDVTDLITKTYFDTKLNIGSNRATSNKTKQLIDKLVRLILGYDGLKII